VFVSDHPSALLDHLRVPYAAAEGHGRADKVDDGLHGIGVQGRRLVWPAAGGVPGAYVLDGAIPLYAAVCGDAEADALLGPEWEAIGAVERAGQGVATVRRHPDGSVFLPFDPDDAFVNLVSERYVTIDAPTARSVVKRSAMRAYYRVRPAMPRSVQIWLRRRYSAVQARTAFPRWPVETALDELQAFVLRQLAAVAREAVPWIKPWPDGRTWALVLTHDVETERGLLHVDVLCDVERSLGLRSSWNFVPRRYHVSDDTVRALVDDGFEVGVHGLYHDGRDLESLETIRARLPEMRAYADRWGAVGFRSPATHRRWEWMPALGFDYDSSSPDTDPFEPQAGGCCSLLPFFNDDLVELPITLPQDHTLFVILRETSEQRWVEKTEVIKARGGMALLNVHPDYMLEPDLVARYRRYLERYAGDADAWHALPRDVSAWWRHRAATRVERRDGHWIAVGAGADAAAVALEAPAYAA
jgi:hypothetical protein